jgi:hypothetical protein
MTRFAFSDLHSFKDYVGFVKLCAPDRFPHREGVVPDEQWTVDLAFDGLRLGMDMATKEKGELPAFDQCRKLIEEAYPCYKGGNRREGYFKLEEVQKLLKKIPSW